MFKLVLTLFGATTGAVAASAWLLSTPAPNVSGMSPAGMQDRLDELKVRLDAARQDGSRARADTENRLQHELAAFRQHPDRPGTSSRS